MAWRVRATSPASTSTVRESRTEFWCRPIAAARSATVTGRGYREIWSSSVCWAAESPASARIINRGLAGPGRCGVVRVLVISPSILSRAAGQAGAAPYAPRDPAPSRRVVVSTGSHPRGFAAVETDARRARYTM